MNTRANGFTLIEMMIVVVIIAILASMIWVFSLVSANFWCTDSGVERQLMGEHPQVTKMIKVERNIFTYSRVTAIENGQEKMFCLNSNLLFNYEFVDCDSEN